MHTANIRLYFFLVFLSFFCFFGSFGLNNIAITLLHKKREITEGTHNKQAPCHAIYVYVKDGCNIIIYSTKKDIGHHIKLIRKLKMRY